MTRYLYFFYCIVLILACACNKEESDAFKKKKKEEPEPLTITDTLDGAYYGFRYHHRASAWSSTGEPPFEVTHSYDTAQLTVWVEKLDADSVLLKDTSDLYPYFITNIRITVDSNANFFKSYWPISNVWRTYDIQFKGPERDSLYIRYYSQYTSFPSVQTEAEYFLKKL